MSNNDALVKLLEGPTTRNDLGITHYQMTKLIEAELVANRRVLRTERRGRPAFILALTSKGRGRAKRAASKLVTV